MKKIMLPFVLLMVILVGCDLVEVEDGDNYTALEYSITGLKQLPDSLAYTVWLQPFSQNSSGSVTYTFIEFPEVSADGRVSVTNDNLTLAQLQSANAILITAEEKARFEYDTQAQLDSALQKIQPSGTNIAKAVFSANQGVITISDIVTDLNSVGGIYTLATVTDGNTDQNEFSGIWFADSLTRADGALAGLNLQDAGDKWSYYAWIEKDGNYLQIGGFSKAGGADDFSGYSSTIAPGLAFPGEDFLENAPAGFTFPMDLRGATVKIIAQPEYLTEPTPFITLLEAVIPTDAVSGQPYNLNPVFEDNAPKGTVNIIIQH